MSTSLGRRRLLALSPLLVAGGAGIGFWRMLHGMSGGSFDPHDVDAPVLNKPVPSFDLPAQAPGRGFSAAELSGLRAPVLVNFFASWCVPCVVEMPALLALPSMLGRPLPVWGIAYKDRTEDASGFLQRSGNPYTRIAADCDGRTAIDWGVSGVPESFLIRPGGIVAWHTAGPLSSGMVTEELGPALRRIGA
ncbi:redoxin domain-containing protein [Rhizosaccharibacter radicis]|uniref:Redoxin domain-containing protein n=1 Tax=Rhizosaccharibacter radicis TaxID=2782605 RepID=A0ABT1VXR9_9PROT|nr:redoxin domain-containing protein [Acetobacteraceae bacterium KSS12]